eukprot:SAG11_NODE_40727_length_199_cov_117.910000_1_plen_34_part_10
MKENSRGHKYFDEQEPTIEMVHGESCGIDAVFTN